MRLTESGAILAAAAAGAVLAAPIGGRLIGRRISAERLAIAGAASIGAGLLLLSAWTEQTPTALRVAGLVVQGAGLGLFQLAYSDIVTAALPLQGSRRCRQSRPADANAGHGRRRLARPDGV